MNSGKLMAFPHFLKRIINELFKICSLLHLHLPPRRSLVNQPAKLPAFLLGQQLHVSPESLPLRHGPPLLFHGPVRVGLAPGPAAPAQSSPPTRSPSRARGLGVPPGPGVRAAAASPRTVLAVRLGAALRAAAHAHGEAAPPPHVAEPLRSEQTGARRLLAQPASAWRRRPDAGAQHGPRWVRNLQACTAPIPYNYQ